MALPRTPSSSSDILRDWYGPTVKAFEAVGPEGAAALERDLSRSSSAPPATAAARSPSPAEYLEVVAVRR